MSLKYSILGLLHYEKMHGYRLKEHIEKNFGMMWSINYGQIYPNLKKLQQSNLITMEEVQNDKKGPPKKLYSITDEGKKDFNKWLESSPEKKMIIRDPFLMKFVFFRFGDKEKAIAIIDEQIKLYEAQIEERVDNLKKWKGNDIYVNLMADLGLKMNDMFLDWLKESRGKILNDSFK